ncbi:hypothetical protein G7Y89_g14921 [Cudoniella acicularis]|uniref:SnoaL-like domain-containing protein n=1 Tax=Cudoniella acicularis TaxID=354080 RepID=A0A8H4QX53_9HELO|nr:hypothetical protein G7Y89_g14921 [Cudoniella acicularis]
MSISTKTTHPSPYPTKSQIHQIFTHLTNNNPTAFYAHVSDDANWTVMGSHILSAHYTTKASFLSSSLARISAVIDGGLNLKIVSIIGGETEEWAVVEMLADARCKNGLKYDQAYSWSTRWKDDKIVEVRAYLDGVLLNRALEENE